MVTESPFWLEEAYNNEISSLDVGKIERSLNNRALTQRLIRNIVVNKDQSQFLDFGGGEGIFVRMMRDLGYNFMIYDPLSEKEYAKFFEVKSFEDSLRFDLITAFEVFEHLKNPMDELRKLLETTDSILISTELIPKDVDKIQDWWYLVPESGQHISFYSEKTFHYISKELGLYYYQFGSSYHLLTKKKFRQNPFRVSFMDKVLLRANHYLFKRENSLLEHDFENIKGWIND